MTEASRCIYTLICPLTEPATNHCPGNGLGHLRIVERPNVHIISLQLVVHDFTHVSTDSSLLNLTIEFQQSTYYQDTFLNSYIMASTYCPNTLFNAYIISMYSDTTILVVSEYIEIKIKKNENMQFVSLELQENFKIYSFIFFFVSSSSSWTFPRLYSYLKPYNCL